MHQRAMDFSTVPYDGHLYRCLAEGVYLDGMDVEEGKYYSYNDKLYKAETDMPACVWPPDTEGLWQWTEVTETA